MPAMIGAQIRPRSGLAKKYGITVLNSPGTIDPGYRGELAVILINHSKSPFKINKGDRIAQLVFELISDITPYNVPSIDKTNTDRQDKGFGSTGYEAKKEISKLLSTHNC
nr:hypothetical trimeric dUTPase [Borodinellopsis texensis]